MFLGFCHITYFSTVPSYCINSQEFMKDGTSRGLIQSSIAQKHPSLLSSWIMSTFESISSSQRLFIAEHYPHFEILYTGSRNSSKLSVLKLVAVSQATHKYESLHTDPRSERPRLGQPRSVGRAFTRPRSP
jgi:hypothetical protein